MIRIALILVLAASLLGGGIGAVVGKINDTRRELVSSSVDCQRPEGVVDISFSKTKYPHIRRHQLQAVREGWPRVLTLTRAGADERRDRALDGVPTKPGYDRDEYPPAVGRRNWRADVLLVPSGENRSHGSSMGIKLRRFCNGTRFRYVWY